jgi:AcrR family transcriptional regulator
VPRLSRDRILRTAIAVADRDGFDAVTLRRIAGELDVHVTSLYNHVPTREAVTDGIVELLIDEAKLPADRVPWEAWVRSFVGAIETVAATHPGAYAALQHRPVQGPRAAASFEVALAAFRAAGFSPEDAYGAVKAATFTALSIGLERAMTTRGEFPQTSLDELPADAFPNTHDVVAVADPAAAWAFAIETLVAGLRAQARRRKRGPVGRLGLS